MMELSRFRVSLLALLLACAPLATAAAPQTARGMLAITGSDLSYTGHTGDDALSVALDDWSSVTPSQVAPLLTAPFWHVVLRTAGSQAGYDPAWVERHLQAWFPLIVAHPEINWILQIGNEPSLDSGWDGWQARWNMLNVYQQLAINAGWRQQYPMLQWSVAIGPYYNDAQIEMQWEPTDGGIRDYYDLLSVHLYAQDSFDESNDMTQVYHELLSDGFTKAIAITELGINDPIMPKQTKSDYYSRYINNMPDKVKVATPFIAGQDQGWPQYSLHDADGINLGDHWRF